MPTYCESTREVDESDVRYSRSKAISLGYCPSSIFSFFPPRYEWLLLSVSDLHCCSRRSKIALQLQSMHSVGARPPRWSLSTVTAVRAAFRLRGNEDGPLKFHMCIRSPPLQIDESMTGCLYIILLEAQHKIRYISNRKAVIVSYPSHHSRPNVFLQAPEAPFVDWCTISSSWSSNGRGNTGSRPDILASYHSFAVQV